MGETCLEERIVFNRFVWVLNEWVALHDQQIWFPYYASIPQCLVSADGRIRANEAFRVLPEHLRQALVAHEIGHRTLGHLITDPFHALLNRLERQLCVPGSRALAREAAADECACGILGRRTYVEALAELRRILLLRDAPASAIWELNARERQAAAGDREARCAAAD